jgi:hypothetical protein
VVAFASGQTSVVTLPNITVPAGTAGATGRSGGTRALESIAHQRVRVNRRRTGGRTYRNDILRIWKTYR